MKQLHLKRIFFITLILISIQNSNQTVEFTVEKLEMRSSPCSNSGGQYDYNIKGKFSDTTSIFDSFVFNVETSDGNTMQSTCSPSDLLSELFCHIDVRYPLNNADILLPTKTPKVDKFIIKNWEGVFGAKPGESNKIGGVTCAPEEKNTFVPSSIEVEDYCILGSRSFTINGDWEQKGKKDLTNYASATIGLDNKGKDFTKCTYQTQPNRFECRFEGEGEIKFKEQYFTVLNMPYKIKGYNSGKSYKKCDDDDDELIEHILSAGSFHFINKILIIISILLF